MAASTTAFGLPVGHAYADLPDRFYRPVTPQPLRGARLLHVNEAVVALLGMAPSWRDDPALFPVCAGEQPLGAAPPIAAVYSGHQFGIWAGQLGDGRAHLLGDTRAPDGSRWEWQLKGSGMTPYSRMGDGRAVLRSSVREYLASEAMAGLGIPTTRALALVTSDEPVYRETVETGAIVTRIAPSFVRFGSFEHWRGDAQALRALLGHVLPMLGVVQADNEPDTVARFLHEVVVRTARLMAQWQLVGFCHGVMNTDNLSVLGLTLDYGPFGFMDAFQADHVCNHSDTHGRYAWNVQPAVAQWNLYRLAGSLLPLAGSADVLQAALDGYEAAFVSAWRAGLCAKFGWRSWREDDEDLVDDWWRLLHGQRADFTLSFRRLARVWQQPSEFLALFAEPAAAQAWLVRYQARLEQDGGDPAARAEAMDGVNPLYVLRNHLAERAIRAAVQGDASEIDTLMTLLGNPYVERAGATDYGSLPPVWASGLQLSCSS